MSKKPVMGLLYGDATGIGSELIAKAIQDESVREKAHWVLIGDERIFKQGSEIANTEINYKSVKHISEIDRHANNVYLLHYPSLSPEDYELGNVSALAGAASGKLLTYAVDLAKDKLLDGIVYGPLNKDALYKGGYLFEDDIHLLASLFDYKSGFGEINVMEDLWVTRATSHIPLKDVAEKITKERVIEVIKFAEQNLKRAGFENPVIAVCALNPHAGDGGLIGKEEIDIIQPAIAEARDLGIQVEGPYPSDTVFLRLQKEQSFDCLLAMYHDQAQTGMKMLGFNKGVTVNGGLPVVLATPAHGTAHDIAGKGTANPGATIHAMKLAVKMVSEKSTLAR
ncbi:4-hydroxythreonine-4-phosphate dehydrogenase PdxA [Metabacillus arenae]|uniref:4-hydroxythreonine-4-phosphate dehydrogenase PdxA n=1 Tax=Metabacillus arenae TaxID=2771434 RepID=A0A926RZA0_9BACI|nr:4-hydroxythreonine-4-phosphate dehydrogenase PdxA [Metabacillus arenae]MBD1382876.1 4-hydroxythreonine-4-phosphate dehydrogenase PdxA [Metabacillus arenae]